MLVSSKRDLPAFYRASAQDRGGCPTIRHAVDDVLFQSRTISERSFLRSGKRLANNAIASVVLQDKKSLGRLDALKRAYGCFLRMNVTVEDLEKTRAWRYGRGSVPPIELLLACFSAHGNTNQEEATDGDTANWSGKSKKILALKAAIQRCQELFPALAGSIYSRKKFKKQTSAAARQSQNQQQNHNAPSTSASAFGPMRVPGPKSTPKKRPREQGGKDTSSNSGEKQFVVDVPAGKEVGDKFQTTVEVGGETKTIRLTVPKGNPTKLKFSMKIPSTKTHSPTKRSKSAR